MQEIAVDHKAKIVFADSRMRAIIATAKTYSAYNRPILLTGETGTGKELIASFVHQSIGRSGPFVPINVASVPENLIESELFGHVRGAFTGASTDKPGLLELADGGTVFFDEVAEMPLRFQAKLLRVIDGFGQHRFRRVGGQQEIESDFRIVCASNRPLENLVADENFYRIFFIDCKFFVSIYPH